MPLTLAQMFDIGTHIIITTPEGDTFKGIVTAKGTQSQKFIYAVQVENPTTYPGMPEGETIAIVPKDSVRLDQEFYA